MKESNLITRSPLLDLFRYHSKNLFAVLSISILSNALIYINYIYLGNYSLSIHKITSSQVLYLVLMVPLMYSFSILYFGFLADYFNKKILLLCGCLMIILFTYPLFLMITTGSVLQQFIGQAILVFLLGVIMGPFASVLPEQFPARVRYSGLSITLNVAASFFGGTAPMVCSWLTQVSGTPMMPAFYIIFLAILAFCGAWFILKRPLSITASVSQLQSYIA
jgi:MHS family proline/betaine transporter-like MFS transporter